MIKMHLIKLTSEMVTYNELGYFFHVHSITRDKNTNPILHTLSLIHLQSAVVKVKEIHMYNK